jgi:hypothetical protein
MPSTRSSANPAPTDPTYDHVLSLIGVSAADHPVRQALAGASFDSSQGLFMLTPSIIESLRYQREDNPATELPLGHQVALLIPQGYRLFFEKTHQRSMGSSDWINTTLEEFNTYRISSEYITFNHSKSSTWLPSTPPGGLWVTEDPHPVATVSAQDHQDAPNTLHVSGTNAEKGVFQTTNESHKLVCECNATTIDGSKRSPFVAAVQPADDFRDARVIQPSFCQQLHQTHSPREYPVLHEDVTAINDDHQQHVASRPPNCTGVCTIAPSDAYKDPLASQSLSGDCDFVSDDFIEDPFDFDVPLSTAFAAATQRTHNVSSSDPVSSLPAWSRTHFFTATVFITAIFLMPYGEFPFVYEEDFPFSSAYTGRYKRGPGIASDRTILDDPVFFASALTEMTVTNELVFAAIGDDSTNPLPKEHPDPPPPAEPPDLLPPDQLYVAPSLGEDVENQRIYKTPSGLTASSGSYQRDTASSIKCDPNQFKTFSDKRLWTSWHLHFVATARAHFLQDVLDPLYTPSNSDEVAVFQAKMEYLYADAQMVYKELCDHYMQSTHAELTASTILTFLTTFKLGKDRWKGKTALSFNAYFVEQLRPYDEIMYGRDTPLADDFKRTTFDAAVQAIDDLRKVRITQSTLCQSTLCQQLNQPPTFHGYRSLLEDAATIYDDHHQRVASRPPDSSSRRVYAVTYADASDNSLADPGPTDDLLFEPYDSGDTGFDVDVPLSTVTAFAAATRRPSTNSNSTRDPTTRLPDSIFSRLSLEDKRAWSRIGAVVDVSHPHGEDSYYGEVLEHTNMGSGREVPWRFKRSFGHLAPLTTSGSCYNGPANGEIKSEPLSSTTTDYPVFCAIHGQHHHAKGVRQYHSLTRFPELPTSMGRIDTVPIVIKVTSFRPMGMISTTPAVMMPSSSKDHARKWHPLCAYRVVNYRHRVKSSRKGVPTCKLDPSDLVILGHGWSQPMNGSSIKENILPDTIGPLDRLFPRPAKSLVTSWSFMWMGSDSVFPRKGGGHHTDPKL